jgi:hypothetical protein
MFWGGIPWIKPKHLPSQPQQNSNNQAMHSAQLPHERVTQCMFKLQKLRTQTFHIWLPSSSLPTVQDYCPTPNVHVCCPVPTVQDCCPRPTEHVCCPRPTEHVCCQVPTVHVCCPVLTVQDCCPTCSVTWLVPHPCTSLLFHMLCYLTGITPSVQVCCPIPCTWLLSHTQSPVWVMCTRLQKWSWCFDDTVMIKQILVMSLPPHLFIYLFIYLFIHASIWLH